MGRAIVAQFIDSAIAFIDLLLYGGVDMQLFLALSVDRQFLLIAWASVRLILPDAFWHLQFLPV